jgi:hypothetical protein
MVMGMGYGAQWRKPTPKKEPIRKKAMDDAVPIRYVIVPQDIQTAGYEVGMAIISLLQHTKMPRIHISQVHRRLPKYIRLTEIDKMQSKSRPKEKVWQMCVHNVKRKGDIAKFKGMLRYEDEFFYLGDKK